MTVWLVRAALRLRARSFDLFHAVPGLVLAAMLTGCGGGGGGSSPPPQVTIATQPSDAHVTADQVATFSVGVTGNVTYRWQVGIAGNWADVIGANSASYSFTAIDSDSGEQFRVIVTSTASAANTVASSAATLTVDPVPVPIRIDMQPQFFGFAYEGEQRYLSVTVEGTAPVYRWQRSDDHGTTWVDIVGATTATFTLDVTLQDDGAQMRVVVANALGQRTTDAATLLVRPAPPTPLLTATLFPSTVPLGQPAVFSAVAIGNPPPTLQWQTAWQAGGPWTDIAGATGGTYIIATTTPADDGRLLRVVATNANGSIAAVATLQVSATAVAPGVSEQPVDVAVATGGAATFSAHGYGAPSVAYQWQVSTDGGATFGNINGATAASYTIRTTVAADDGKRLRVVVTNTLGSVTSNLAQLAVMDPPALYDIGAGERWRPGVSGAYLLARATGGQLHYQWQVGATAAGGPADVAGQTARDFELPSSTPATMDQVCVKVSNPVGSVKRCATIAALTWQALDSRPMLGGIRAFASAGAGVAVAGGADGALWRSADAGVTWTKVSEASWSLSSITSIAMRGSRGIATTSYDTRFTADGGKHWYSGPQDFFPAEGAVYAPDGTLVKVGDAGVRLSSDDGTTWRSASVDAGFTVLWRAAFNASGVGVAVGAGQGMSSYGNTGAIVRSADGGASWKTLLTTDTPVSAVAFVTDNLVIASDWQGTFWRSTDAGLTWSRRPGALASGRGVWSFAFLDTNTGVAYDSSGVLERTTDGGLTWIVVGPASDAQAIIALDANTLLAGGGQGTPSRSVDGGFSWTPPPAAVKPTLIATAFIDASTGVVVGTGGTIERTTDAGATWNLVPSGVTQSLGQVRFGDATHGMAVGDTGAVLRTSDAGVSWQPARSPTQPGGELSSVAYATPGTAFVGGLYGLWKTTDGGTTWQSAGDFGAFPSISLVSFGDALHGLVAGENRQFWRTTDGGQNWTLTTTNFDGQNNSVIGLQDLTFVTPTTVVGVTSGGGIVRSTDAGATWQLYYVAMRYTSHVYFRDALVGIVIGDGIARTTDGGLTWTRDPGALSLTSLGGAAAVGAHSMIVVGESNLIYRNDGF